MRRRLLRVVAVLLGLYGAVVVLAYACQRRMLYPAPPRSPRQAELERAGTLRRLRGPEGQPVLALHMPAPVPRAPTVVYFHGNGEQLGDLLPILHLLQRLGLGVCAVEYPGYGLAAGTPSEAALYAAAETALLDVERSVPAGQLVLLGQSLGTGVAAEMARRGHGTKLVLLSPYTSMADMAALALPLLPGRYLVRDRFDTWSKAKDVRVPVLIIHGTDDELIPVRMGQALSQRFPQASLLRVYGRHHNDLWDDDGSLARHIAAFAGWDGMRTVFRFR